MAFLEFSVDVKGELFFSDTSAYVAGNFPTASSEWEIFFKGLCGGKKFTVTFFLATVGGTPFCLKVSQPKAGLFTCSKFDATVAKTSEIS